MKKYLKLKNCDVEKKSSNFANKNVYFLNCKLAFVDRLKRS